MPIVRKRPEPHSLKPRFRRHAPLTLSVFVATALATVVVIAPQMIVNYRGLNLTPKERVEAEADLRSSLIQLLGGGILVTGLYFTARGFSLTREGHITDRYAKAIEQIGTTNADVRIGGIYALERIARDSQDDRETVIDVLSTYIREHTKKGHRTPSDEKIGADVQAALLVVARRPGVETERRRLDFYCAGLNDADFAAGDFRGAMFDYGRLDNAHFGGALLDGADLSFCKARGAAFTHTSAQNAHFVNATFSHGWFLNANLENADFSGCDLTSSDFGRRYDEHGAPPLPPAVLTNARFTKANLKGTILRGVDLRTLTGLTPDQLREAITDENTLLPLKWRGNEDDE